MSDVQPGNETIIQPAEVEPTPEPAEEPSHKPVEEEGDKGSKGTKEEDKGKKARDAK